MSAAEEERPASRSAATTVLAADAALVFPFASLFAESAARDDDSSCFGIFFFLVVVVAVVALRHRRRRRRCRRQRRLRRVHCCLLRHCPSSPLPSFSSSASPPSAGQAKEHGTETFLTSLVRKKKTYSKKKNSRCRSPYVLINGPLPGSRRPLSSRALLSSRLGVAGGDASKEPG